MSRFCHLDTRNGPLEGSTKLFLKVSQCRKKLKGGTLYDFSTSILSQNSEKSEMGTLWGYIFFSKKCPKMPKKLKDPLVLPVIVCFAEKKEKPFWFSSLGQQVHFCDTLKFCRVFGRTILVTSGVSKKTLTKSHDYSRLFSQEKRRLKRDVLVGK